MADTDRIERKAVLKAPRSRVWRAIADAEEFGTWFGMKIEGAFVEGAAVRGRITHPGYEHLTMGLQVERIEPERYFSVRWHADSNDPAIEYSSDPATLVEFRLEDAEGGTLLTIVESGFDQFPLARRAEALRNNGEGWTHQMLSIERHVSQT